MTSENNLTEEFFKVFGIEPKKRRCERSICIDDFYNCNNCKYSKNKYPEITDRKLLQMICIINEFISMLNWKQIKYISTFEIETLKENILKDLIWILSNECNDVTKKQLKHQIRQLFKEEE